jgi:hypothetical protein
VLCLNCKLFSPFFVHEGIDQEGDEVENNECLSDNGEYQKDDLLANDEDGSMDDDEIIDDIQVEEADRERRELLIKANASKKTYLEGVANNSSATSIEDKSQRLEYLLAQSEGAFSNFISNRFTLNI